MNRELAIQREDVSLSDIGLAYVGTGTLATMSYGSFAALNHAKSLPVEDPRGALLGVLLFTGVTVFAGLAALCMGLAGVLLTIQFQNGGETDV